MPDPIPFRNTNGERPSHKKRRIERTEDFSSEVDGFDFDNADYDIGKFYVRATDGNGVSSRAIQVPVAPSLYMVMERWLNDHTVPAYRNRADFLRDALLHRMKWINDNYRREKDPIAQRAYDLAVKRAEAEWIRQESDEEQARIDRAAEDLAMLASRGDWGALHDSIRNLEDHAEMTREPYKRMAYEMAAAYREKLEGQTW